jgi:predicted DNA-binding antitoxin AbrB/MazE fold protein
MELPIQAIFENGVFRPLGEVALPDHLRVVLRIENGEAATFNDETEAAARRKRAMAELDAELERLPDESSDDGLSSADHDRILYGGGS